jgi:hypothetical protein
VPDPRVALVVERSQFPDAANPALLQRHEVRRVVVGAAKLRLGGGRTAHVQHVVPRPAVRGQVGGPVTAAEDDHESGPRCAIRLGQQSRQVVQCRLLHGRFDTGRIRGDVVPLDVPAVEFDRRQAGEGFLAEGHTGTVRIIH